MKPSAKLVDVLIGIMRIVGLVVAVTPLIGLGLSFQSAAPDHPKQGSSAIDKARGALSSPEIAEPPQSTIHWAITRYLMGFAGDRSLDVATAVEQVRAGYMRYTVRLQISSGSDQSIAVIAPPGGLRPEVRDMTGDGIRNDLVLTPKLLHWPVTFLINDGHDHFLAISGALPGSWGSEDEASGKRDIPSNVALRSSGFRADFLPGSKEPFHPPLRQASFSLIDLAASIRLGHRFSSGRAPPSV